MRLLDARVQNYRSISDSGTVTFDPEITCIVGKTGSGKTSFLRMLEGASRGAWFGEQELPRPSNILQDFRDGRTEAGQIVQLTAAFEVEDADRPYLPKQYEGAKRISVVRTFDGRIGVCADGVRLERASTEAETAVLPDMLRSLDSAVAKAVSAMRAARPDSAGPYKESTDEAMRELAGADIRDKHGFEIAVESLRSAVRSQPPADRDVDKDIDLALRAMSNLADKIAAESRDDPVERLYEQVPKPLYIEDVFKLDDEVAIDAFISNTSTSKTFRSISAICGLTPGSMQRIRNANPAERAAYLEAKSRMLSGCLNSFWSQEEYRFELAIDGGMLRLRVTDSTTGATTLASERSEGFKWWMAFFLIVSALLAKGNGRLILLLDNPATGLHDEGKGDVLRFIRTAAESGRLQIVYSTHERVLIDPWRTDRVKIVGLSKEGTKITTVQAESDGRLLETIMKNIGSPARYSLFGAPRTISFEGPSDTYIVSAVNEYALQSGVGSSLAKDMYSINTFGGIDAAPRACQMYGDMGLEFVLVVDSGTETISMKRRLGDDRVFKERFVEIREVLGRDADMEDMVDRRLYHEAFKLAYETVLAGRLPPVDEIDGNPRKKRANNYAEWFRENGMGTFNKTLVAQRMFTVMMGRGGDRGQDRAEALGRTAENFARLFKTIVGRCDAAAGRRGGPGGQGGRRAAQPLDGAAQPA